MQQHAYTSTLAAIEAGLTKYDLSENAPKPACAGCGRPAVVLNEERIYVCCSCYLIANGEMEKPL